jgi:hypothetical protein
VGGEINPSPYETFVEGYPPPKNGVFEEYFAFLAKK